MNKNKKKVSPLVKAMALGTVASAMTTGFATTAFADDWGSVDVKAGSGSAKGIMGKIIGVLLTITQYVGVALIIYGVYEIVLSFMQNQPEAKTKGIVMALAGAAMSGMKAILTGIGVI